MIVDKAMLEANDYIVTEKYIEEVMEYLRSKLRDSLKVVCEEDTRYIEVLENNGSYDDDIMDINLVRVHTNSTGIYQFYRGAAVEYYDPYDIPSDLIVHKLEEYFANPIEPTDDECIMYELACGCVYPMLEYLK